MSKFPHRVLSLVVAVALLFSAAAISFVVLFRGIPVFADSDITVPQKVVLRDPRVSSARYPFKIEELAIQVTHLNPEILTVTNYNKAINKYNEALQTKNKLSKDIDAATDEAEKDKLKAELEETETIVSQLKCTAEIIGDIFSNSTTTTKFEKSKSEEDSSPWEHEIIFDDIIVTNSSASEVFLSLRYPLLEADGSFKNEYIKKTVNITNVFNRMLPSEIVRNSRDDDDDDSSSSKADIAPPTPNIIISEYSYGGGTVRAASDFALTVKFTNTSKRLPIDNIVMKVAVPEAFMLTSSSNTFYIEKMAKGSSVERTINLSVKPGADPISHPIKLSFSFEAVIMEQRKQFTSEEEISIPVAQLDRFTLNPIEMPAEIFVGEDMPISVTFINKGKTPAYNVSAEISGNISQPGQRQFIGNLESGKEESADFMIGALEEGSVSGEVIITYEDANMNIYEVREAFNTTALPAFVPPMDDGNMVLNPEDMMPEPIAWYLRVPPWGWMVGGLAVLLGVAFIIRERRRRREAKMLEEQDEDL